MTGMEQLIIAVVNIVLGGFTVKLADYLMQKNKIKIDESSAIRTELWTEIHENRKTIDALNKEADDWRAKYWKLLDECSATKAELRDLKYKENERHGGNKTDLSTGSF